LAAVLACGCSHEIFLGDRSAAIGLEGGAGGNSDGGGGPPTDAAADAPKRPPLWTSDHETGDLSAWWAGGSSEGGEYEIDGTLEVTTERAHGGSHALKATIDTSDHQDHLARVYRRTVDGGAYYGAWFFWDDVHVPDQWWSIFLFRTQFDQPDSTNLWDLYVVPGAGGEMVLSFFDHLKNQSTAAPAPASGRISAGRWVHIEAYFEYRPPDGTHIAFWLDGMQVFDLPGLGQAPSPDVYWAIGNGSNGLAPPVSVLYIDDATIARDRVGIP
jgi:hypothetical protein